MEAEVDVIERSEGRNFQDKCGVEVVTGRRLGSFGRHMRRNRFTRDTRVSTDCLSRSVLVVSGIGILRGPSPIELRVGVVTSYLHNDLGLVCGNGVLLMRGNSVFVYPPGSALSVIRISNSFTYATVYIDGRNVLGVLHSRVSM